LICQGFAVSDKKPPAKNLPIFRGGLPFGLGERLNGIQEVMGSIPTVSIEKSLQKLFSFCVNLQLFTGGLAK